jgi:hypothetical protein
MILENITIINLGAIEHSSFVFADGLNLLHTHHADKITQAIRILLNHKDITPFPQDAVRADTRIEATVFIEKKQYKLIAVPDTVRECFSLKAYNAQGGDATSEYLYLTDHCAEQDRADIFEGTDKDMSPRFLQYANEDVFFSRNELSSLTGDLSNLKAFRAYLRYFIAHFQPELIREGKYYEIVMKNDGRYDVRHKHYEGSPVCLSESEQILFRYRCFLRTAEFWRGFEDLRNLHGVKKPLIIKDFLERIDELIDTSSIMNRTMELGRQVIILTLPIKNKDREVF